MKITVNKMDLVAGLNKLTKIISAKTTIQVLTNVKILAKNNAIELIGSNTDLSGIVTVESGTIEENGGLLLNYKDLTTFIKKSKSDFITIENNNNNVIVSAGKVNFKVDTVDVNNYPLMPELDYKEVTLNNEEFKKAIENTGYSIHKSDIRPVLQAINIKVNESGLKFVSTDSHRLGQYELNKINDIEQLEVNPLGEGLKLALKLLDKKNKEVTLKFNGQYTLVVFDNMQLFVKNIEGNYPDTSRLIPSGYETQLELKTAELLELLPQLAVFNEEKNSAIILNNENNIVNLSNVESKKGVVSSNVETLKAYGNELKLAFNQYFLEDVLKVVNSKTVKLKFNGSLKPFTIEGNEEGEKHLILPVRTY